MKVRIYNGAPNFELKKLKPHRSVKMRELWPGDTVNVDYGVIDGDHVQSFVASLPNDRTYEFDCEGNAARPDLNLHLWDYQTHPEDAVRLREEMSYHIWMGQSGLDRGFWSIPSGEWLRISAKNPSDQYAALAAMQTQLDYQQLASWQTTLYQTAYWRYGAHDFDKIPEWKTEVRTKIGLTETYCGKTPRMYIWHRGYKFGTNDANPDFLDSDIFNQMVGFISDQGVEMVFWSEQADTEFPPWVERTLSRHAL
jgi:hypothetical protein